MVLRAILRNVQNTLVLSSALLVILALQRLQHYEFRADAFVAEQHHDQHESLDTPRNHDFHVGMNHHVILGRMFQIGLFRFFLPRLERTDGPEQVALRENWEVADTQHEPLIHYVVDLSNFNDACDYIDAAAILSHSLRDKYVLHVILNDTDTTHATATATATATLNASSHAPCNATAWLTNVGCHVVRSSEIALNRGCTERWQAYALQNLSHVDVVVSVPVTTVCKYHDPTNSFVNEHMRTKSNDHRKQQETPLSKSVYSSRQSIQLMRPKSADVHDNDCRFAKPTVCRSSPFCQMTKHTTLLIPPRKCALPWTCPNTTSRISPSCRLYHDLWKQQRHELLQETNNNIDFCVDGKYQSIQNIVSGVVRHSVR